MRTTITIADDIATELRLLQEEKRARFKDVLHAVLRAGLATLRAADGKRRRAYRTRPVSLGTPRLKQLDDIAAVIAFAEGEEHR